MNFYRFYAMLRAAFNVNVRMRLVTALLLLFVIHLPAQAQLVGTIGVGDLRYVASSRSDANNQSLIGTVTGRIEETLTKTRKFSLLDLDQLEQRFSSQGLNLSGFYRKDYDSSELKQIGLDYILTAGVSVAGKPTLKNGKQSGLLGLKIDAKLFGVGHATEDISFTVSSGLTNSDLNGNDAVINRAVDKLVAQIIAELHPIRVIGIDEEGLLTLNYGEGWLSAGDTVLVYPTEQSEGEQAQINATPIAKLPIATLKVSSNLKKFATAKALTGFDALELGQPVARILPEH